MSSLGKSLRAHKFKLIIVLKVNEKFPMLKRRTVFSKVIKLLVSVESGEKKLANLNEDVT